MSKLNMSELNTNSHQTMSYTALSDLVGQCNCEGFAYVREEGVIVVVLHPHNSLEDAKYCMTVLENYRPLTVMYEYNIRLTQSAFDKSREASKLKHTNINHLG